MVGAVTVRISRVPASPPRLLSPRSPPCRLLPASRLSMAAVDDRKDPWAAAAAAPLYEPEPAPQYEPAAAPEYEPENTSNGLDFEEFDDDFGETRPLTGSGGVRSAASGGLSSVFPACVCLRCLDIAYYQQYFNVETDDVVARLWCALLAYKGGTIFDQHTQADLYGPLWISATVALTLFSVSNLSAFMEAWLHDTAGWTYDFSLLFSAFSILFGYVVGGAGLLWAAFRWRGHQECKLADLLCIYGYAGTVWTPMTLLCIIPMDAVRWATVVLASGYSTFFLNTNLRIHLKLPLPTGMAIPADQLAQLAVAASAVHFLFGLVFKRYFFPF